VAIAFAHEGADVLVFCLPEEDDARATARWVGRAGRCCVLVPGGIADQEHCKSIVERAVSEFGKLDILVKQRRLAAHREIANTIGLARYAKQAVDQQFACCAVAIVLMLRWALAG
jgi:NAD(P)-dependent dehydrogenase (short-subunit alcohol dehydrogenase family)